MVCQFYYIFLGSYEENAKAKNKFEIYGYISEMCNLSTIFLNIISALVDSQIVLSFLEK